MAARPPAIAAVGPSDFDAAAALAAWAPPQRLRIGPLTFTLRLGPAGTPPPLPLAEAADAAPAAPVIALRPWPSEPPRHDALTYPQWRPPRARALGRKFALDFDFARGDVTWWWPQRRGAHLDALWELSVLATTQALALASGGLLLHAAAIDVGGEVVVVTGPSGAGKSTLAARFAGRVLHDDVIALVPDPRAPTGWSVWSQDGWRPPAAALPPTLPLARLAIFSSDRSKTKAESIVAREALSPLAAQTYFAGGEATSALMAALAALAGQVPMGRFSHCLSDGAAEVLRTLREGG